MFRILQDFYKKIKRTVDDQDVYVACIILCVGIVSFWLGTLSVTESVKDRALITIQATSSRGAGFVDVAELGSAYTAIARESLSGGAFVGARNGSVYYPARCSYVSRIKPENRVYFTTADEAESVGRKRSTQCK